MQAITDCSALLDVRPEERHRKLKILDGGDVPDDEVIFRDCNIKMRIFKK